MPLLKLQYADGSEEECELSRSQPLSVGRQSFNDVCIPEDDVGAMHCRISWNKTTFEVTAATGNGVDVNGFTVAHASLKHGDVIRIGSIDLIYADPTAASPPPPPPPPIPVPKPAVIESKPPRAEKPKRPPQPEAQPVAEMSLFMGPVYTQSQELPVAELDDHDDEVENGAQQSTPPRLPSAQSFQSSSVTKPSRPVLGVPTGRRRPGEQDVLTSPLVLGLGIGGGILLLVTGIFWFLISRQQASRLYDRAMAELSGGQNVQAIASFETFVKTYPRHALRKQVDRGLEQAFVQKEISGASPAWKAGLEQLRKLIANHREEKDFPDLHPLLFKLSEEISLGAAKTAESARDAELLIVSDEARALLERYADPTAPPTATLARIKDAKDAAERAIGKQNTFDAAMAAIEAALANKQPIVALAEREKLLRRFTDYGNQKRVRESLQKALDLERSVLATDETERPAETNDDPAPTLEPILGLFHARSRTDEASAGRVAYVLAKESCYAVDTVTGELVWRRVIGFDAPFFPMLAVGAQPCLLVFDSRRQALLCCQPATGKLIWRQMLDGRPRSTPLVHDGQIYLPTDNRSLCRIDLDSGRLLARVTFSQNVLGPPVLSYDGNHLLIPGDMAMIYSLSLRPLAAKAMTFTDHAAGAIVAPPLSLGKLLLLCENDKADSSRLRLFDAGKPVEPLTELAASRIPGPVRDTPVLRGNQLVIPSSGEQLAAFSVTDETGRAGLAPIAQYRVKDGFSGPMFIALGPDRQFWSASSAFRRFEIGADSIRMDPNAAAQGIASQPLQLVGEQFFVGRKAAYHDAVVFSAVDRERLLSPWRTVLGAELLELVAARTGGGAIGLNEAGQIVSFGPNRLKQGGTDLRAASELELPPQINAPVRVTRLHDDRLALAATGEPTQLWIVNTGGQIDFTQKLNKGDLIEANPVLFDDGLVVPLSARLKLLPIGAGRKSVQDWLAPAGEKSEHHWRFLLRLDGRELIACDDTGLLTRVQLRTTDVPHLAGAAKLQLEHPVDIAPALRGETLFVADAAGTVRQLNARSFDVDGQRAFASPVRGVWAVGSMLLVWDGEGKLHATADGKELDQRWVFALDRHEPAGEPLLLSDKLWIACRDGLVLVVDAQNGKEARRIELPQTLTLGLRQIGDDVFAIACDGTLYRLAKEQP